MSAARTCLAKGIAYQYRRRAGTNPMLDKGRYPALWLPVRASGIGGYCGTSFLRKADARLVLRHPGVP
jgi:hypothetical protein